MFEHVYFEDAVSVVGIDICFSDIGENALCAIRAYLTASLKLTDLSNAEWYWVKYPEYSHVIASHEIVRIPDALWPELEEILHDIGSEAAAIVRLLFDSSTKCKVVEFHYLDQRIKHSSANMQRI